MLTVEGLEVRLGSRVVLEGVTFTAGRGLLLIAGPNGAGKSTLFKAVLNLLPYRGKICVDGVCGPERVRHIGYVPQRIQIEAPATVWEFVYIPTRLRGARDAAERAREALKLAGISELRDRPVAALSGGQLQRAAVARALATGGEVLLLDEPLSNIDPQGRIEILSLLSELKRERVVLMTSHELTLPSDLADRVLLLNRRVVAFGAPGEVLREEVLRRIYRYVRIARTPEGLVCATEDYGAH